MTQSSLYKLTAFRLRNPSEMDPRPFIKFLILGLTCVTQVLSLSIPIPAEQLVKHNLMEADMLELDRAIDIRSVCPLPKTFCIPRVKCPLRSIVYDREASRFVHREEKFIDHFACGAFSPTWTYVCCSTLEKIDSTVSDWQPKPDLWFYPPQDGSSPAKDVDLSTPFPVLPLWPEQEPSTANSPKLDNTEKAKEKMTEKPVEKPTEKPKEKQQNERSVNMEQTAPSSIPPPGTTPFMMIPDHQSPTQQMWMNPSDQIFTTIMRMMDQQRLMFNPFIGMDPRFLPSQMVRQDPSDNWLAKILIFPDGRVERTIKDLQPMNFGAGFDPTMRRPTLDSPPVRPMQTVLAPTDQHESSSRTRRSLDSKSFKVPPAAGGMWKGENNTDQQGRALLPPPKVVWGSQGSGNVPFRPIPQSFGVDNERCGISSSTGINARVLSGRKPGSQLQAETSFAEFPWHVAVVNGETGDYLCAGTIISARFVLTVAHCVRKFQLTLLFVRVGDWDLSGTGEMFPSYDVEVQSVMVHEEFYAGNLQNDIALLQLKFPLDFTIMPHVGTICLPPSSDPIYSDCVVTGWGQQLSTAEAKGDASTFSRTLKQTSQTLVTAQFCEKTLRPFLGQFYQLPKKGFVCAYDKDGKDSCFGDGGGALACLVNAPNYPKPMQYHVVGLVSWGVGCGMPNVPSAYTAIWDYLDWIRAKISPLDSYPIANPQPLKEPSPVIMVRSNEVSSTTAHPTTTPKDFIDLAFS